MDTEELAGIVKSAFTEISRTNVGVLGDPSGEQSFVYVRVSSSGQAEEGRTGLPRQLRHIHEKAQQAGLSIALEHVFFDDHTGFEFRDRPGLQALLEATTETPVRHITIEYIDRLSRQAKWHQGYLLELFADRKLLVHFWKGYGSEIERAVMGTISEQGMRHEIERMTEGTRLKAESKRITAKTRAYGYMFADSKGRPATDPLSDYRKDTHYMLHPEESRIMEECYHRLIGGDSLYVICDDLNRRGVPTPKGAKYWQSAGLCKMLKNPVYKGEYIANRYFFVKEWNERSQKMVRKLRQRPSSEWIRTPVPSVVSPEVWDAARDALRRNLKLSTRRSKDAFLLQGMLYCAKCGELFGSNSANIASGKRYFYICRSRQQPPIIREQLSCNSPYIRAEDIDPQVWQAVCEVITNPDMIIQYMEEQVRTAINGGVSDELAYIERELAKCEREESQWDRAFAAAIFSLEEYRDKKKTVAARKSSLLDERARLGQELQEAQEYEQRKEFIRQHIELIVKSGFDQEIPIRDKRRILSLLVDRVLIDTNEQWFVLEGAIEGTFQFDGFPAPGRSQQEFFTCTSAP